MPAEWLAAVVTAAAAQVVGTGDCPSSEAITRRLAGLVSARPGSREDHARIERRGDMLVVVLTSPEGTPLVERRLAARGSCDDLVEAVAVIVAAWQGERHPGLSPNVELAPSAAAHPTPTEGSLSVRALGSAVGGQAEILGAPGALVAAGVWRGRLGLRATLWGAAARTRPLASGSASWTRYSLGLGPAARWRPGRLLIDVGGAFVAGWLAAQGAGYADSRTAVTLTPGAAAALDISRVFGERWLLALGLGLAVFPYPHDLSVDPTGQRTRVPAFEGHASAGLGVAF